MNNDNTPNTDKTTGTEVLLNKLLDFYGADMQTVESIQALANLTATIASTRDIIDSEKLMQAIAEVKISLMVLQRIHHLPASKIQNRITLGLMRRNSQLKEELGTIDRLEQPSDVE